MSTPPLLNCYQALLLPWGVRDLEDVFTVQGTSWHDGDTFNAMVSMGLRGYDIIHVRCAGYNSPEITGVTKDAGKAALAYVQGLVESGQTVWLDSADFVSSNEEDNFGRMLAFVTLPDGRDLADVMIAAGQGVPDPA